MILNQSLLLDQKAIVGPTFEKNHDFESKFTFGSKGTILDQKLSLVKKNPTILFDTKLVWIQ